MNNLFEEHQYQRRLIPWLIVVVIWFTSIWHIYNQGLSSVNLVYDILSLLFLPLVITLLLFFFKLSIKVDNYYLMFKMFPFHWEYKKIKLDNIDSATTIEYNKGLFFNGWGLGISWSRKYKSYTVKGNQKVEIILNDGRKIFIGTQHPEALIASLKLK